MMGNVAIAIMSIFILEYIGNERKPFVSCGFSATFGRQGDERIVHRLSWDAGVGLLRR